MGQFYSLLFLQRAQSLVENFISNAQGTFIQKHTVHTDALMVITLLRWWQYCIDGYGSTLIKSWIKLLVFADMYAWIIKWQVASSIAYTFSVPYGRGGRSSSLNLASQVSGPDHGHYNPHKHTQRENPRGQASTWGKVSPSRRRSDGGWEGCRLHHPTLAEGKDGDWV